MPKTSSELLTLWEAGKPLQQAVFAFAPKSLSEAWAALQDQSATKALELGAAEAGALQGSPLEKLQAAFDGPQKILTKRADLLKRMRWNLTEALRREILLGVAFEFPRALASTPVELHSDHWRGSSAWDTGELNMDGLRFIEVRILTPRRAAALLGGNPDGTARKPGRPSYAPDIEAAFHALHGSGKIDSNASMSSHYPAIRAWLQAHRPTSTPAPHKPGDEAIRRVVAPLFRALADEA